jgi:hypothetical protein
MVCIFFTTTLLVGKKMTKSGKEIKRGLIDQSGLDLTRKPRRKEEGSAG